MAVSKLRVPAPFHLRLPQVSFKTDVGVYALEVTTFQLSVLHQWNRRSRQSITFEDLRLATQLSDIDLRRTLWVRTPDSNDSFCLYKRISNILNSSSC